jgi:hypothetical protein
VFLKYSGDVEELSTAEKFLWKMYRVNRIHQRLEILSFQSILHQFIHEADEVGHFSVSTAIYSVGSTNYLFWHREVEKR